MSHSEQIQQLTGLGLTILDLQRTLSRRLQAVTTTLIINIRNINLLEIHFIIHSFTIKASILSSVCRKLSLRAHLHFAKALMVARSSNGRAIIFLNASTLGQCYRYACLGFYVYNPLIVVGLVKTLTNSNCLSHFVRLPWHRAFLKLVDVNTMGHQNILAKYPFLCLAVLSVYVCVLFSTMHVDSSCCFKTIMLVLFCMAALASGTSPHLWTRILWQLEPWQSSIAAEVNFL